MDHVSSNTVATAEPVDGVHLTLLAAGDRMSVQHFQIEPGATVPEHSHPHEQVGYLVAGELTFLIEGEEIVVQAGDSYSLASEEPHGVENRGDTVVEGIDVFSPPRTDPDWA
ncbi:MAG: cupin domain-containing protein [Halobacteriota archaeon]